MSQHLSGRLDHSPPRTGYEPNRVPMEEVVDLTGGDSADDLPDVNQDAHAIAHTSSSNGQGRQALQHQRGQFEVPAQQYEEEARQKMHHAVKYRVFQRWKAVFEI